MITMILKRLPWRWFEDMGDEVVLSSNPRVLPVPAFFLSSSFPRSLQNGFSVVCTKLKNGWDWNTRPNQSRLWYYAVTVQWVALLLWKIRWQMVCQIFGCHCSNLKLGCWCVCVFLNLGKDGATGGNWWDCGLTCT